MNFEEANTNKNIPSNNIQKFIKKKKPVKRFLIFRITSTYDLIVTQNNKKPRRFSGGAVSLERFYALLKILLIH